jgi:hypothetical protein
MDDKVLMSKDEERKLLIDELIKLRGMSEYAEIRIPKVLKRIKELVPTEEELDTNELDDLFIIYSI